MFPTDPARGNRPIAREEARQHLRLLAPGDEPDDAPRSIEHGIGQGHPAPSLIDAGERDVGVRDVEHRISGHERGGVAVGSEAQVGEIEHGRRAGDLPQRPAQYARSPASRSADSTGMAWTCSAGIGQCASRLSRRWVRFRSGSPAGATRSSTWTTCTPRPGHVFVGQGAKHLPRSTAPADGDDEAAASGDRSARLRRDERGARARDRIGIGQDLDPHDASRVRARASPQPSPGFCQPPGRRDLRRRPPCGPQVPGSYS